MSKKKRKKVFVGLSGGVDSSVAALRLIQQGYDVCGVFIKVWHPEFLRCEWERERLDAMRVAAHLEIPFLTFDAEDIYKKEVADYMIGEYAKGRTPNPDVMCNRHIKFGAFLNFAQSHGADRIATGHYAQIEERHGRYHLLRGKDSNKDQSYFLWTLTQENLAQVLFPIGDTNKEDVRKEAERAGLPTARKHDSQGICFLGKIDMKEFLSHYISMKKGDVVDVLGNVIGSHDGALFYTIGQRHGFTVSAPEVHQMPHYVVGKDIDKNVLIVDTSPAHLTSFGVQLTSVNEIQDFDSLPLPATAQFRYRQKPFSVNIQKSNDSYSILLKNSKIDPGGDTVFTPLEEIEMPSVGQSCVLYHGDECIGGGIIE